MPYVIDLSKRSRIKVSGQKANEFLNSLCSNDISGLDVGNTLSAAFLDRFAKIISVSHISNFGDFFLIESDSLAHIGLLKHLKNMASFSDCKVESLNDEYKMFSVIGFEKGLMKLEIEKGKAIKKKFNTKEIPIVWNIQINRVDFFVKTEESDGFPEFLYRGAGIEQKDIEFYEIFRTSNGIPEYGKDYDSSYTLMEVGTENVVSYTKGCYTGQEVVARVKSYGGQLPKKVIKMEVLSGTPSSKEKLLRDGIEAGFISSVIGKFAIGTLKKGFDARTELKTASGCLVKVV